MPRTTPWTATPAERAELMTLARTAEDPRVRLRARMVLAVADGQPFTAIGRFFQCDRQTPARWTARFRVAGAARLADRPRAGRPPLLTPEMDADLAQLACQDPQAFGVPATRWTCGELAAVGAERWGVRANEETIREHLHALNLRFTSPKLHLHSPDPEYRAKRGRSSA